MRRAGPRARRALLAIALAAGCSRSSAPPRPPAHADAAPSALFLAAFLDGSSRLHALDADGRVRRFALADAAGSPADLHVHDLHVLSRDWAWLLVDDGTPGCTSGVRHALLRIADGRVLDGSFPETTIPPHVKGDRAYVVAASGASRALASVDLTTMEVHRIAAPAAGWSADGLLVDGEGNVRAHTSTDGTTWSWEIFPADGRGPVADPWHASEWPPDVCAGGDGFALATTYGADGRLFALCVGIQRDPGEGAPPRRLDYFVREVAFTGSGTTTVDSAPVRTTVCEAPTPTSIECPDGLMGPIAAWDDLRPRVRRAVLWSGFITLTPTPAGGLSASWTDLRQPAIWTEVGMTLVPALPTFTRDHAWYRSGNDVRDDILRLPLRAGATVETVATVGNLLRWTPVGSTLLFTTGTTWSDRATYQVTSPGLEPELIWTSEVLVQQAQEL